MGLGLKKMAIERMREQWNKRKALLRARAEAKRLSTDAARMLEVQQIITGQGLIATPDMMRGRPNILGYGGIPVSLTREYGFSAGFSFPQRKINANFEVIRYTGKREEDEEEEDE